jgi:hypothetical protein
VRAGQRPSYPKLPELPSTSQGRRLACPHCGGELLLVSLRDGDQGHWCPACERGWRLGHLPLEAFLKKAMANQPTIEDSGLEQYLMP